MASILPIKGGFRAAVYVSGTRATKQFRTKREAQAWASARETELRTLPPVPTEKKHTLQEAFDRYYNEVATTHKGERWEQVRLAKLGKEFAQAKKAIGDVTTADLAAWRDTRLQSVSASSVLREIKLFGSVFEIARKEWGWLGANPGRDLKKPRAPEHRKRTITTREIRAMLSAMDYNPGRPVRSVSQATAVLFLAALRTGMRAGELTGLTWVNVFPKYCHLPDTKSDRSRDVPLSPKAARTLERMRGWDAESVFSLKSQTLDALFRRYRDRAGLSGFTFHDARHTAATWMSRKVDVLTLCKICGWSDPKMAMVYYNPKAEDIAGRL
jgi:integrase